MQQKIDGLLVPKLRFPEFLDAGEWEEKKLLEVCDVNPSNEELPEFFIYIDLESVVAGKLMYKKKICKKDAPSRAQRLLKNGDVIYQVVRPYQRNNFLFNFDDRNNYVASTGYAQLRSFGVSEFLYQLIHTDTFVNKVIAKCTGSNYPAINSSDLAEINVVIPLYSEQQKIADCLSSISDRITLESQKLDTLKAHKKGLMQQLFPAEGETMPKLRFPEFGESWEKSTLDRLIDFQSGYAFQSEYFSEQGEKLLTPKNFTKNGYADFNKRNTKYTVEDFDPKYVCKEGDLLLLLTDLTPSCELLGKPLLLIKSDGDVLLNQRIVQIISKGSIKIGFLFYFFLTESFHKRITDTATGSTVRHSSNKIISSTEIYFPLEREQQKIADCLSSLDELIAAQAQAIDTLKTHKKGLMQQLFPSVEEVKG